MGMKTVAIIGALDEEVALIAKSLTHVTHTAEGSLDIVSGTVDSFGSDVIKVAATVGGMGLVNASATTQLLVEEFHSDAHLLEVADAALAEAGITHIVGIIASGNYFVDTPEKVEEVIRLTGADAVEMEGAAVAQVAARNDVPALVVRALSDNADTDYEVFKEFDISEYADTAARLAVDIVKRL